MSSGNEETREMVTKLVNYIADLTDMYIQCGDKDVKAKLFIALEAKADELKAFLKKARDNDAI